MERQDQEKMIIGQTDKDKDQHWTRPQRDKQRLERPKGRISPQQTEPGQTGLTEDQQRIDETKGRNSPGQTGLTEDYPR